MSPKLDRYDMTNKNVLITGASGLLGMKHAVALLELNARVILLDIDIGSLERTSKDLARNYQKDRVITLVGDVSDEESITNISFELEDKKLRVDVLVNNAALNPKLEDFNFTNFSRLETFPLNQWDKELNVGLKGAFICAKVFGSKMASDDKGGNIINISSDLSIIAPDQRLYADKNKPEELQIVKPITYSVIKTGLIGLTRYLATYWSNKGVRCNALSPGGVENGQSSEFKRKIEKLIPLGRMASSEEYIGAVQFLCSDASKYMNGQNLIVDGGRSIW